MTEQNRPNREEPTRTSFLGFLSGNRTVSERTRLRQNELARLRTERALRLWYASTPRRVLTFLRDVFYMTTPASLSLLLAPMALTAIFRCLILPLLTDDFPLLIADGVTGILLALLSLLLAAYRTPFCRAVTEDPILSRLLFGALALPRPYPTRRRGIPLWLLLIAGVGLAVLSVFASPLRMALWALALLLLILTLISPDFFIILFGILFPLAALHPAEEMLLLLPLAAGTVSYLIKLLLGKRRLAFESVDLAVLLTATVLLVAGLCSGAGVGVGFAAGLTDAGILLLGYLLTANLLTTRRILFLFTRGILFMSAILSALAIFAGVLALLDPAISQGPIAEWLLSAAADMLGDGEMTAAYLLTLLPMLFCVMTENDRAGWHYLPFLLLMLGALGLTLSPIAYFALLMSLILLAILATRGSAAWFAVFFVLLPNCLVLVTESFGEGVAATLGVFGMEEGVLTLLADLRAGLAALTAHPTGIGPGHTAAELTALLASFGGITGDGGSLYLSLGVIYGIPGIVAVVLILAVALRDAARACRVSAENHFRTPAMGAACGLFTLTILAPYVNVLAARSMLLLAVMALGMMTAARRAGRTEEAVLTLNMSDDAQESASVTVRLGRAEH